LINNKTKLFEGKIYLQKLLKTNISKNYYNWFKDILVKKYIKSKYDSKKHLLQDTRIEIKKKNQIFFGIFIRNTNKHIGNIKFHNINIRKKTSYLGILIGEKTERNKGYGTKAIYLGCQYLFINEGIEAFYLKVDKKNTQAINAYKRSGFKIYSSSNSETLMLLNFRHKKFILGTAQFGNAYGISNIKKKKLKRKDINEILRYSKKFISEIDIAEDYNIENQIKQKLKYFKVNTKIDVSFFEKTPNEIVSFFIKLRNFYNINILYIRNLENISINKRILKKIKLLKDQKIINKIGISIYSYKNIKTLYELINYDVIQLPLNIFDNRCDKFENFLIKNNIEVHARSVFLQGLFFMSPNSLNKKLFKFKYLIEELASIANKLKINMYDLALSHVLSKSYVKKIIFGVHDVNQLNKTLNFKFNKNNINFLKKFDTTEKMLIDPRIW
jgi:RimJ/RimL family protein N-acetyltransferase